MSSEETSSPVSASTLAYLMRCPVLRLIWLNETFSVSDVAGYRATGEVTSERRKKPFQLARGAMGYSENATDQWVRIPPWNPVSKPTGRESPNGGNRRGAGWLLPSWHCPARWVCAPTRGVAIRHCGPKTRNIIQHRALLSGTDKEVSQPTS